MVRAARMWPASAIRAASVSPDLSVDASRVSDTVMMAMRTGTNLMLSSIPGIADDCGAGVRRGRRRGVDGRRTRRRRLGRGMGDRPIAGGCGGQARGRLGGGG